MKVVAGLTFCATILTVSWLAIGPQAQEIEEIEGIEAPEPEVTESELETYIEVYAAMQEDHTLQIEVAVAPHGITLQEFRSIERRVQKDDSLVQRVRDALLERVQARAGQITLPPGTAAASKTPTVRARK